MPANTSQVGLPYPIGSDLVRDGDNAIRSLAEDTDKFFGMIQIKPTSVSGTGISMDSRGTITFSGVNPQSSVFINGIFSAMCENYRVVFTTDDNALFTLCLSVGGVAVTSDYYATETEITDALGPNGTYAGDVSLGSYSVATFPNAGNAAVILDLERPFVVARTTASSKFWRRRNDGLVTWRVRHVLHDLAVSYDGLRLQGGINPGTLVTGTMRVYGFGQ